MRGSMRKSAFGTRLVVSPDPEPESAGALPSADLSWLTTLRLPRQRHGRVTLTATAGLPSSSKAVVSVVADLEPPEQSWGGVGMAAPSVFLQARVNS